MLLGRCCACGPDESPPDPASIPPTWAWISKPSDVTEVNLDAAPSPVEGRWLLQHGQLWSGVGDNPRDRLEDRYRWWPDVPLEFSKTYLLPGVRFEPREISSGMDMWLGGLGIRTDIYGGPDLFTNYYSGSRTKAWERYNLRLWEAMLIWAPNIAQHYDAYPRQHLILHGGDTPEMHLRANAVYNAQNFAITGAYLADTPSARVTPERHTGGVLQGLLLPIMHHWFMRLKYVRLTSNGSPVGDLIEYPGAHVSHGSFSIHRPYFSNWVWPRDPARNYQTVGVDSALAGLDLAALIGSRVGVEAYMEVATPIEIHPVTGGPRWWLLDAMQYAPSISAGVEMSDERPRWQDSASGTLGLRVSDNNVYFRKLDTYSYRLTADTFDGTLFPLSETFGEVAGDHIAGDHNATQRIGVWQNIEYQRPGQSVLLGQGGLGGCQMIRTVTFAGIEVTVLLTLSWNQRIPMLVIGWLTDEHVAGLDTVRVSSPFSLHQNWRSYYYHFRELLYLPAGSPFLWREDYVPVADFSPWEEGGSAAPVPALDSQDFEFLYRTQNPSADWASGGSHEFQLHWNTRQGHESADLAALTSSTAPNTITVERVAIPAGHVQGNLGRGMYTFPQPPEFNPFLFAEGDAGEGAY